MFGGNQDTLFITKTHIHISTSQTYPSVCTLNNHLSFKRTVALAHNKRNNLPSNDISRELKKEDLVSIFFWLFCCLFKTLRTSHGIWWVKSSSLHFIEN